MKTQPVRDTVSVRLRLSPREAERIDRVRAFLGLRSLSATCLRLALWNADTISASLGLLPDRAVNPREALRMAIVGGGVDGGAELR